MPEFLVEYVVTQHRFSRVQADTAVEARQKIVEYHEQEVSDRVAETVIVISAEEDN